MKTGFVPKMISAERLSGGVIIAFNNGQSGFYTDALLYASLPKAQDVLTKALEEMGESNGDPDRKSVPTLRRQSR